MAVSRERFQVEQTEYVDYKDTDLLERFTNDQGKILPRRVTGLSSAYQRKLTKAIKRARHLALLPYVEDNIR